LPRERLLHVCALSISANPHPEGIYVSLLRRGADFIVHARGSDYAKITVPERDTRIGRYYTGRILIWTEIDLKGKWLDITKGEELSPEIKNTIQIPPTAKPNFRSFNYALDNERHLVYFENRNEFGQTLGPSVAKRIFTSVLSPELQGPDAPEIEVTIVPETDAVDKILKLPGLRTLYIKLVRPNPDISDEARQRILGQLSQMHARREEITIYKTADAVALTPTSDIEEMAGVAADDGEVRGEGRDANGRKLEVSTTDFPQKLYVGMERGGTFLSRLLSTLRR
jgi:Domain of unknown function (DUF4747)